MRYMEEGMIDLECTDPPHPIPFPESAKIRSQNKQHDIRDVYDFKHFFIIFPLYFNNYILKSFIEMKIIIFMHFRK